MYSGNAPHACWGKLSGKHKNLGSNRTSERKQPGQLPLETKTSRSDKDEVWEDFLDEIYLPDALPGQHFHIDFDLFAGQHSKFL